MFGPCCNHVWPSSTFRLARFLNYSRWNQFGPWDIFLEFLFLHSNRVILGPCWVYVCLILALRLARALKFSVLGHSGLQDKTMEYSILMIMQEPCWDPIWISFTWGLCRASKFWKVDQLGPSDVSMEFQGYVWTMLKQWLAKLFFHIITSFGSFKIWLIWSKEHFHWVSNYWAIMG